jgi:hypothetical protein
MLPAKKNRDTSASPLPRIGSPVPPVRAGRDCMALVAGPRLQRGRQLRGGHVSGTVCAREVLLVQKRSKMRNDEGLGFFVTPDTKSPWPMSIQLHRMTRLTTWMTIAPGLLSLIR